MSYKKIFFVSSLLLSFVSFAQHQNVVFILVDDLKPLINSYGEEQIITPNFDAFAEESVVFTNAHTQQAVCAPSRVSFMTGMRPDFTQVLDLKTHMRDKVPNSLTIAEHFKNNGYTSVGLGKVLHGAKNNDPQSWSVPFIDDDDLTYSKTPADFQYQNAHTHTIYNSLVKKNTPKGEIKSLLKEQWARPSVEKVDVPDEAYADGALALKGISLMKEFKEDNTPFFMTLGFRKPHLPFTPPKKYWDLYKRDKIKLAEYQERIPNTPQYAYHSFGELKNYSDILEFIDENGRVMDAKQRELIHGYYASVSYIDAQLGKVLSFLKSSGLDKNTIIVLIGDHGWHLGDHGLWNKHSNYEQATRTPFYVKSPNSLKGIINNSPVELIDAFPTMCELAEIEIPKHLQGKSLVPVVTGKKKKIKEIAISQYPRGNKMGYSVRNERYRYVEWRSGNYKESKSYIGGEILAKELYDYEEDPLETRNLANDPAHAKIQSHLQTELFKVVQ